MKKLICLLIFLLIATVLIAGCADVVETTEDTSDKTPSGSVESTTDTSSVSDESSSFSGDVDDRPSLFPDDRPFRFESDTYPGKTLIRKYPSAIYYPFFIVDEEIAKMDWWQETAFLYKGRIAELDRNRKPIITDGYAVVFDEQIEWFLSEKTPLVLGGTVIAYARTSADEVQNYTVLCKEENEDATKYIAYRLYDTVIFDERSGFALCYGYDFNVYASQWWILDRDGNWRSLPLEDKNDMWAIKSIEFDTNNENPNVVIVDFKEDAQLSTSTYDLSKTTVVDSDYYEYPPSYYEE